MAVDLPAGRYRRRTLHPGASVDVEHLGGAFPALRVTAGRAPSRRRPSSGARGGTIAFANDAGFELAALIEDRTWSPEALTAPEGDLAASLPRSVRRRDLAAGRRGRGGPGGAALLRPAGARPRSTSAWAMPRAYNVGARAHFALLAWIVRAGRQSDGRYFRASAARFFPAGGLGEERR